MTVYINSLIPEVSSDTTVSFRISTVSFAEDDICVRVEVFEALDKIFDFHFFFLPDLIHDKVRALQRFFS